MIIQEFTIPYLLWSVKRVLSFVMIRNSLKSAERGRKATFLVLCTNKVPKFLERPRFFGVSRHTQWSHQNLRCRFGRFILFNNYWWNGFIGVNDSTVYPVHHTRNLRMPQTPKPHATGRHPWCSRLRCWSKTQSNKNRGLSEWGVYACGIYYEWVPQVDCASRQLRPRTESSD